MPADRSAAPDSPKLAGIQALRGVAALLVVFVHYNGTAVSHGFSFPGWERAAVSGIGVDIFFVISGFIMELTAGGRSYRAGDATTFLKRRAARVLPLYWALTVLAFAATLVLGSAINSSFSVSQFILSMLLLPATGPDGQGQYVVSVAWTLAYEMYFYLLFAALLRLTSRQRISTLALLFAASIAIGLIAEPRAPLLRYLVDPILLEFLAGCALANALRSGWKVQSRGVWLIGAAGVAAMLLELTFVVPPAWRVVFWGLPAFALVASVVLSKHRAPRFFEAPFTYLGNISYSLYLSHFFTVALFTRLQARWSASLLSSEVVCLVVFLALAILVAHLCYRLIESPSRRLLCVATRNKKLSVAY